MNSKKKIADFLKLRDVARKFAFIYRTKSF
jgi:hypothetical protein